MPIYRATLFALAVLFTVAMSSSASAGCCGGCGGCGTPSAAFVYAEPVAPAPPPPVVTNAWTWGTGCGCHRSVVYLAPQPVLQVQPTVIAPAPIYVVNQGPVYSGPGIMVPYQSWSPNAQIVAPGAYPYVPGYGYGYGYPGYAAPGPRIAYRTRVVTHVRYRGPMPLTRHWHH